jgi:hypothetical protein
VLLVLIVLAAARAGPSPVPTGGVIRAVDANGVDFGFVNAPLNIFGEYGITQSADTVLAVSAQLPADGSAFDVVATNPVVSSLPLVGFTTGFANSDSNLGPGSLNYAYLTAQSTSSECAQLSLYPCPDGAALSRHGLYPAGLPELVYHRDGHRQAVRVDGLDV